MSAFTFISYSRTDIEFVRQLAEFLTDRGVTVWFDIDSLSTGDRWEQQIRTNIEACTSMIVVMSQASAESTWVRNEVNLALSLRKPILPVLLGGEPFFSLGHVQFEDVRGGRLPGDVFAEKVRKGGSSQGAVTANAVRRPYVFDGTSFFEPADLIGRMQERWELALDQVAGSQTDALDAWLASEVRDTMLPTNILHYGTGDERIARLAAHFRAHHPPVFRSRSIDVAGLVALAWATWDGDASASAIFGAITTGLLDVFAFHEGCADLRTLAATIRTAVDDLSAGYGDTALPAPGVRVDLLPVLDTPRGGTDTLRVAGGLLAILYDDGFAAAVEADLAALSDVPRSEETARLMGVLPALSPAARRAGLLMALLAARGDAERHHRAEAERRRREAEAERLRQQAEEELRHQQAEDERRRRRAEEERRRLADAEAEDRRLRDTRAAARWLEFEREQARSTGRRRMTVIATIIIAVVAAGSYVLIRSVWPPPDGGISPSVSLAGHTDPVNDVEWSPDGKLIATASQDHTAGVWDPTNGTRIHTLTGHTDAVRVVRWSPDGTRLATAGQDSKVYVWDAFTGVNVYALTATNVMGDVAWSPDGTLIAAASWDGTAGIWDATTGAEIHTLTGHTDSVDQVRWSPDGTSLATTGSDGTRIWDTTTGQLLTSFSNEEPMAWSPDGAKLATIGDDGAAHIRDATTDQELYTLTGYLEELAWSPDSTRLATADNQRPGDATIWDAITGQELHTLTGQRRPSWSPDGTRLATLSGGGPGSDPYTYAVRVWDTTTGQQTHILTGQMDFPSVVAWAPDGTRVAAAIGDGTVRIWDIGRGTTDPGSPPAGSVAV